MNIVVDLPIHFKHSLNKPFFWFHIAWRENYIYFLYNADFLTTPSFTRHSLKYSKIQTESCLVIMLLDMDWI